MPASKTIYVDVDGKKLSVIGDPSKIKKTKVLKEKDGRDTFKTIEVDTPRDLKQGKPEPAPQTTTKPMPRGIKQALKGGGRAYGQNS